MEDEELRRRLRETVDGFGAPAPGWRRRVMAALPDRDRHPARRQHWMVSTATTAVAVALVAALVVTLQLARQSSQPAGTASPSATVGSPSPLVPGVNHPGARASAGVAYDAARRRLVLTGGIAQDRSATDTWTWDGRSWEKQPGISPPVPAGGPMAYDGARQQVVLFTQAAIDLNKKLTRSATWTRDDRGWTEQAPAVSPPTRGLFSLAYDGARKQVVLFGGTGSGGILNDTWTWDGTTWVERHPAASPPGRMGANLAYDESRGVLVLFGGLADTRNTGGGFLNDTWTWDGRTWTLQSGSVAPPARSEAAMAYDRARDRVVLFGGNSSGRTVNDQWLWDGKSWSLVRPSPRLPLDRFKAALVYDDALGKLVLYGGQGGADSSRLGDLWTWDGQAWKEAPR